jgi:hypothetical protein
VYLDSFAWKLGEQIWSNGLGVWLPASLPHDTWFSPAILNAVLNHRMLVSVLSDLTLVFEATFIVLMWLRAARPILCVIGLGLHVSIVFAFPIPFFGLSLAALYLLLAPAAWYEAAARAIRRGEPQCVIQFDAGSPRWRRALLILEHFDFRGRLAFRPLDAGDVAQAAGLVVIEGTRQHQGHAGFVAALRCHSLFWPLAGLYGRAVNSFARTTHKQTLRSRSTESELAAWKPSHPRSSVVLAGASHDLMLYFKFAIVAACTIIQATLIADAPYFRGTHMPSTATPRWLADTRHVFYGYAGICSHGVFLDSHFKDYDHIIAVTWIRPDGSEQWLPLTTANGQVGAYAMGRFWCKWVIRNNGPYMSSELLKSALREVTAFWARKNRVDLADAKFKVLVRKYDPCKGWQPDYLLRQTEKPWTQLGLVQWKDRAYTAQIAEIKRL